MEWLVWFNQYILAPALPVCLMGTGVWYGFALRFFWLRSPGLIWKTIIRPAAADGVSPAAAMSVALAGTLGVGNIVGVASAIALGGPGAIFWMWISALCAMVLKYAEITLALCYRRTAPDGTPLGGAMYYISTCFGRIGPALGTLFALLCLCNALTMGSVVQVRAVSSAFSAVADFPPIVIGLGMTVLVLLALRRGLSGVAALTERLIPLASLGYVLVSALALICLRDRLPAAAALIFTSAFSSKSAVGGIIGFLLSRGLRYGTMRGLLSNEAGCGTAPAAHAASTAALPAEQGIWGIVEVFVDTILLCTMTALVILASGVDCNLTDGMLLTLQAYRAALGPAAGWFLAAAIFIFAYATILCWAHYGVACMRWFGEGKFRRAAFLVVYAFSICLGAVAAPEAVWEAADFALGTMTLINLCALCILMPEVNLETDRLRDG